MSKYKRRYLLASDRSVSGMILLYASHSFQNRSSCPTLRLFTMAALIASSVVVALPQT